MQLEEGYAPSITFVVVQKRHHTRVFPNSPRDAERSGNVIPGTSLHPFFATACVTSACLLQSMRQCACTPVFSCGSVARHPSLNSWQLGKRTGAIVRELVKMMQDEPPCCSCCSSAFGTTVPSSRLTLTCRLTYSVCCCGQTVSGQDESLL